MEKGKFLKRGKGINSMLRECYNNKGTEENSILIVKNPGDIDSGWSIYEKK